MDYRVKFVVNERGKVLNLDKNEKIHVKYLVFGLVIGGSAGIIGSILGFVSS